MPGLALAAAGAVAIAACDADRSNFISPIGDVILDFGIAATPSGVPAASGGISAFTLVGFDPNLSEDAFGRATGALGSYGDLFGDCFGFNITGAVRNSSEDPRLPALAASDASVGGFFTLLGPQCIGAGFWDLFGEVLGLAPNTTYTVALARMSLTVNGQLDAEQVLLGEPVTEPDELTFLGGTEGGDETAPCDFSTLVGVDASTNPVGLGTVITDGAGDVVVDCLPFPVGDSPWWRSADETPAGAEDSVPVGVKATTADGGGVVPGQYNYVLLIEGIGTALDPVPDVNPTVRMQIGPDIDASGNVVANGFPPFPTEAATDAELLAGPGGFGRASEVNLTATNLTPLSGVYQVWLLNQETGDLLSPTGDITITNEDDMGMEVIVSQSSGNTFNPTDPTDQVTFVTSDAIQGSPIGNFTHIFVSIEGAAAGTPSAAQPLWGQFTDMAGMPEAPLAWTFIDAFAMPFGTFDLAAAPVPFAVAGFGQGAFTGTELGTADLFRARFRNLTLPPVGYYYEGFMRRIEDGEVVVDVSTGDLTTEFAEGFASLRDVDVDRSISTQLSPTSIIESANRATLGEVGSPFETFDDFLLRLRPKLAATATSGAIALQGTLPETLKAREQ